MRPYKRIFPLIFALLVFSEAYSQPTRFSLATDLSILRSFKENQQFWSLGQTVHAQFHFTRKDGAYAWISYYTVGKFTNTVTATAKSPATTPQQLNYTNFAELRPVHFSVGWKTYLLGDALSEEGINAYGIAGFGLMFGRVSNLHSMNIDTSLYIVPVESGEGKFRRLTFDLGLGFEKPVGGDLYAYIETRVLIPTTDYPSKYLFVNDNAPLVATANIGLRILF